MLSTICFMCFFVIGFIPYLCATTHPQMSSSQNIRIVDDNNDVLPFRSFRDESSVKILIARDTPEGDLGVYDISYLACKRAFLKSCFSDLKEYCISYQTQGIKDLSIGFSLITLGITMGIYFCYCSYILIENQVATLYYTLMPSPDSFDYVYSNFGHMNLSSDIIATNKMGDVISYLMVNNKNLMDDINILASYSIDGALPDQNLVDGINKKTSDLFLTYKYLSKTRRIKTIFTRFCYGHEQSGGHTVESHVFNKKIPLHQYETVFQQNCPGLAIIIAKWPINPFQLTYGISSDLHASFDINVIHPYQCLDEESDDMNFRTNRRLLKNKPSAVEKVLQKVADDFKKTIDPYKVLQEIVTRLNKNTCPGTTLIDQFGKKVFPLRWVIQQLNTDYVRLKVWYGPNYSVRHVIAEPLPHAIKSRGELCDFEFPHDLEGADVVIDLEASNSIRITTQPFMPTYTAEKMVTHSLIPTISYIETLSHTKISTSSDSLSSSLSPSKSKFISFSQTPSNSLSSSAMSTNTESVTLSATATSSDTVSESMSPSKSESVTLPVKWTADIPTEILSNVSYKWTEIIANGTAGSPSPRCTHAVGRVGDEIFVGFGIRQDQTILSDVYLYNITSNTWRILNHSTSTRYRPAVATYAGSTWVVGGDAHSKIDRFSTGGYDAIPYAGISHVNITDATMTIFNDNIYFFGGRVGYSYPLFGENNPQTFNDLYICSNFSSTFIKTTGTLTPSPRSGIQFSLMGDSAYMFGGESFNDIWFLNLTSYKWTKLNLEANPSNDKPSTSVYSSGATEDNLLIFGGYPNRWNDLWGLNITSMTWNLIMPRGQVGSPPGRSSAGNLAQFGQDFYLFGGSSNGVKFFNDLWRLRQTTLKLLSTEITPNSITAGQPFNLSWQVNTTSGAHNVTVMFDDQNYTQTFNTSMGWMMLNMSNSLVYNFSLILMISDFFDYKATVRQVIPFYRT